jgi:XapX domain-containing protein
MAAYAAAIGAGLLVGVIYSLLGVRSPAPPVIALLGLLGMLLGEQLVPLAKRVWAGEAITLGWFHAECRPHIFGRLPTGQGGKDHA